MNHADRSGLADEVGSIARVRAAIGVVLGAEAAQRLIDRPGGVRVLDTAALSREAGWWCDVPVALGRAPDILGQPDPAAFAEWFGASVVTNGQGEPLPVFHGTRAADFTVFDLGRASPANRFGPGFYFTQDKATLDVYSDGGRVIPVFLRITRPQIGDALTEDQVESFFGVLQDKVFPNGYDATQAHELARERALQDLDGAFSVLLSTQCGYISAADWVRGLDAMGIDGIIREVNGCPEYVVLHPGQIKSAVGNTGQFDPENPDIMHSLNQEIHWTPAGAPSPQIAPLWPAGAIARQGGDPDVLAQHARECAALERALQQFEGDNCAVYAHAHGDHWKMLGRDAQKQWFVQGFDMAGPLARSTHGDKASAERELDTEGYSRRDDLAFVLAKDLPGFQRGLFASEVWRRVNGGEISFAEGNRLLSDYDGHAAAGLHAGVRVAQAFYTHKDGTVVLVADRIAPGREAAVFLHEIVHKHGPGVVGAAGMGRLIAGVKAWANASQASVERSIHDAASARARASAWPGGRVYDEELFAYAVEEAVLRGVRPTLEGREGSAEQWLGDVVATLQGVVFEVTQGALPKLDAQRIVDLAYALAQLESPEAGPKIRAQLEAMKGRGAGEAEPRAPALASELRFDAGKSLTREQRKAVLDTLVDVYKAKGAPREMKGIARNGNERSGYVHSPELFEKSDITGAMVRYYVTLPDGRRAHPTELFPGYTKADIDREMERQHAQERSCASEAQRLTEARLQFDSREAAESYWDDRSAKSVSPMTGQRTIYGSLDRTLLTNGDRFVMVPDSTMVQPGMQGALLRAGWGKGGAAQGDSVKQTETPEFKRWFGDSKVVDSNGKPLVVYHGTSADFDAFAIPGKKTGRMTGGKAIFFAADPATSSAFARYEGAKTIPVYLRAENMFDFRNEYDLNKFDKYFRKNFSSILPGALYGPDIGMSFVKGGDYSILERPLVISWMKRNGYDGMRLIERKNQETFAVFDPLQIKSATGNNGQYDPASPDIRFSFAGPAAGGADPLALSTAQGRLVAGEDPETVRQETGWFQGADAKWRYEISDHDAVIIPPAQWGAHAQHGSLRLGGLLHHPSLYAAYPLLAETPVTFRKSTGARASMFCGEMQIDSEAFPIDRLHGPEGVFARRQLLRTVMHEVQHAIQDREAFASGGNWMDAFADPRVRPTATDASLRAAQQLLAARLAALAEPLSLEEFARQAWGGAELTDEVRASYTQYCADIRAAAGQRSNQVLAQEWAAKEWYRRLAGEVEARNVSARLHLTQQERAARDPGATADVADADVIVLFGGQEMHDAAPPVNVRRCWHGSPYRFDQFDLARVRSGEGALAFGWGIYLSEARGVAKNYTGVDGIGGATVPHFFTINGVPAQPRSPEQKAADLIYGMGLQGARKLARGMLAEAERGEPWTMDRGLDYYAAIARITDECSSRREIQRSGGHLYEVSIPGDGYLLWDAPMCDQPPEVLAALREHGFGRGTNRAGEWLVNMWGAVRREGFEDISCLAPGEPQEAMSRWLSSIGIRGIQYLDGDTRSGRGEACFNYVVFQEKDVQIERAVELRVAREKPA